jgi:hypothetical protein
LTSATVPCVSSRRYAPSLLETFEFRAAPAAAALLEVIEILRTMNRDKSRSIPQKAPLEWIPQRWQPYVVTDEGIDRRFYELCALTELKNRLRSGDIWVSGSRQFKDFDAYLLAPSRFHELRDDKSLTLPFDQDGDHYIAGRIAQLTASLDEVNGLAARGELPDAAVSESGLKITGLANTVPEEAGVLMRRAYALLPHIKITELLLEVDAWTSFSRHFTHLKTGEPAKERILLLTAILADGINLGISKMAEACPGTTARKLDWLASLHIRDEAYTKALAELVNHHHQQEFAGHWGEGTTSSSDGQRFRASGRGEQSGQVNLRYGNEPGVLFYTHISDQSPPSTVRSLLRMHVMPPTFSTVCCTTNLILGLRNTSPIRPVSPITSLHSATCWGSALRPAYGTLLTSGSTCQGKNAIIQRSLR